MKKTIFIILAAVLFYTGKAQEHIPVNIGFSGTALSNVGDIRTASVGGPIANTQWQNVSDMQLLSGFRFDLFYVNQTFNNDLFVSKGYYANFVELKWEVDANLSYITGFKIYRKEYQTSDDSILVATVPAADRLWRDEFSEANVLYEYTLYAEGITNDFLKPQINYITGVGLRVPTATVTGRVTYAGGTAVEGVKVIAESEDIFSGSSIYLNGSNAYISLPDYPENTLYNFDTAFTFQAWIKPENGNYACIMSKGNQYSVYYQENQITFNVGGTTLNLPFEQKTDTFFNISASYAKNTAKLYVFYNDREYWSAETAVPSNPAITTESVLLGRSLAGEYYTGNIDEVRLFRTALTETEIFDYFGRYISGTEENLTAYIRLNENKGVDIFDISRRGFTFNENHGSVQNASWSAEIPHNDQLSYKGTTDANGNYIIAGLPYGTDGTVYSIVPMMQSHEFDPTENLLFVSSSSSTHNNINFTDISSFRVTGNIVYKDTYFPVQGVNFYVDGTMLTYADGTPVASDNMGNYEIEVPIGYHYIEARKFGHTFTDNARFPIGTGTHDFQEPITGLNFTDNTLIKLTGKVVGGPIQGEKPIGLGLSDNNIGHAKIVMTTQKGYDLTRSGVDSTTANLCYKAGIEEETGHTSTIINAMNPQNIEIYPDTGTGEFIVYLLPEKYTVSNVTAGDYVFDDSHHITIDLTGKFANYTESAEVFVNQAYNEAGELVDIYRTDSISYNHNQDFILRVTPSVDVTKSNGDLAFWETEIEAYDGSTISIIHPDGSPKTLYPVFRQRNNYNLKISVFEQYINADRANATDNVPVTDGQVEIQNELAINNNRVSYQISEQGTVNYSFAGGLPNIATGGIGDYVKTFNVVAKTGQGGSITTAWLPNGNPFRGYVFGGMPTGSNFVTKGPDQVKMILRDPPGSESYAYLEEGASFSTSTSTTVSNNETNSMGLNIDLGSKMITFAGVGTGVITETEVINDVNIGMEASVTWVDNSTTTETYTLTETWQTSTSNDYVNAPGDLFIGNSTNIVYGVSTQIDLLPTTQGTGHVGASFEENGVTYDVGLIKSIRVSPEFSTSFIYTQAHIKLYLIPNLKMLRNNFLINQPEVYQCVICDQESDEFGRANTTGAYTLGGYIGGDSYNITIPDTWDPFVIFEDSVAFYNEQIKMWENWLAHNEKEKIDAEFDRNISFDAGAIYENSISYEKTYEHSFDYTFSISPSVSQEVGFEVFGCGTKLSYGQSYTYEETSSEGNTQTFATTFGYVLEDENTADYISIDVKTPPSQTGPVFAVRGGQTMCPYEGAVYTEYYNPGTPLSEATMQREVPVITCENPMQIDIPEDAAGIFNLQLSNASQSGDIQWVVVSVDEQSNQDGALIKLDGTPLHDGRMVLIEPGQTVNKILTVEKVQPDVYEYENLGIILHSACQFDPTDFQDLIADTVKISAYFQRVCSGITLGNPSDQWIVNTNGDTTLTIDIENYNLAHSSLEKILFQYKSKSTPNWTTGMTYYINEGDFDAASEPKSFIDNQPNLTYSFDLKDMQDREYDIKVKTICADGTINESIIASGIKDVKRPKVFGTPQPGDGILNPGDDVMITFDETIQAGALTPYNFSVKGVLNGTELQHEAAVYFNGTNAYATAQRGVNLNNKSFTVSFWIRRGDNNRGVIFAQNELEIGLNNGNKFYVAAGNQTFVSQRTFTDTQMWNHVAVTYNSATNTFAMYVDDVIECENIEKTSDYNSDGKMYLGRSTENNNFFNGYIHELRVWEEALGFGNIYAMMYQNLAGNEIGLAGLWQLTEASGNIAEDKVRSNHTLLFNTSWVVFPTGQAAVLNGITQNIVIPTVNSVLITDKMDMTIEFYFNAQNQANTVLFSNGNDSGDDLLPQYENIWNIGFDANSKLYVKNNGSVITLENMELNDNKWHHFAMVLSRQGNTSVYIDGNLIEYAQSLLFGGLMGYNMSIGAQRNQQSSDIQNVFYDKYFTGSVDEFRIWKLARTTKQLKMDMNNKLNGDEMGLLAYYPFEKANSFNIIEPSLEDFISNELATGTNTFTGIDVPSIKVPRRVQDVAFDWVVNDDKVIININEQPSAIEKCILEFTVDRVEDMRENRIASPVTWTAYVKQNTVTWGEDRLEFEKELYEPLSFNVDIFNTGGTEQNYSITNLPAWLTCSQSTGMLGPDSYSTVSFDVNEALNIGNYTVSLYLTSDFGYNEKLDLNISVRKQAPDWNVNPANFQYSANVIAQLLVDSIVSTDEDDMIAAFVNGECRGVEKLEYVQEFDAYMAFIDVYSNIEFGDSIVFRVWDASSGQIITQVTPNLTFESNTVYGTPDMPLQLYASSYYEGQIALNQGWNWMSFNLNAPNLNNLPSLMSDITVTDNMIVKGQLAYDIYSEQADTWFGNLSSNNGINNNQMYMIKLAQGDTLIYEGPKADVSVPINLEVGWNWISYKPQTALEIEEAFASFAPTSGDLVKNQTEFAMYNSSLGWIGSLSTMKPGKGYMYKALAQGELIYPEQSIMSIMSVNPSILSNTSPWSYESNAYPYNMNMVVQVYRNNFADDTDYVLGAFVNGVCRGYADAQNINNQNYYFLTVSGETADEEIDFLLYNPATESYLQVEETEVFEANNIIGELSDPVIFNFNDETTNIDNLEAQNIKVYPNPFNDKLEIVFENGIDNIQSVEIHNVLGQTIYSFDKTKIINNKITWNGTDNKGQSIASGVYVVSVKTTKGEFHKNVIKK